MVEPPCPTQKNETWEHRTQGRFRLAKKIPKGKKYCFVDRDRCRARARGRKSRLSRKKAEAEPRPSCWRLLRHNIVQCDLMNLRIFDVVFKVHAKISFYFIFWFLFVKIWAKGWKLAFTQFHFFFKKKKTQGSLFYRWCYSNFKSTINKIYGPKILQFHFKNGPKKFFLASASASEAVTNFSDRRQKCREILP